MIVVGVDRSPEAETALRWAIDEAELRQSSVCAVYVWQRPVPTGRHRIPQQLLTDTALNAAAKRLLDRIVDGAIVDGDPPVERVTIEGLAAKCLADAAQNADLLVVGSHHHGLGSVGVGSVSAGCARRAACPVVVVHHDAAVTSSR